MDLNLFSYLLDTLDSGIDVGQGINIGPGKFGKKNKHRALSLVLLLISDLTNELHLHQFLRTCSPK